MNVGQLKQVANNLNNRINQVADDSDAGVASAMATAGLPQAFLPGKSMAAVAGSTYRANKVTQSASQRLATAVTGLLKVLLLAIAKATSVLPLVLVISGN